MASKRPCAIDDRDSEQQRRSVEHEFWTRHQEKCGLASEYKPLLDAVVSRVRALAEAQDLEAWDYEAKLHEAEEVLAWKIHQELAGVDQAVEIV